MDVVWDGAALVWGKKRAAGNEVLGFHEQFGVMSGRAWLEVRGPNWRIPISEGYGAVREALRQDFADRPFTSDWMDGRFPAAPGGLPPALVFSVASAGGLAAVIAAAVLVGTSAGVVTALVLVWPLVRLRDAVVVRTVGVRAGPAWAGIVPWNDVHSVKITVRARSTRVWVRSAGGTTTATLPTVLVPAFRARVGRLGGLEVEEGTAGLDEKYERWRAAASGIPWGILAGALVAAWATPKPWTTLAAGLLASAATGLLGAAVEARATGWGAGAVLWLTLTYGVVLAATGLGWGGWLGW